MSIVTGDIITSVTGGVFDLSGGLIQGGDVIASVSGGVFEDEDAVPSPALVMAAYMIALGLVSLHSEGLLWPVYVSHEPDGPNVADNCVTVYDTTGKLDGRLMRTGEYIEHPGIQIRVRSKTYELGYSLLSQIRSKLDITHNVHITVNDISYLLQCISRTSPILCLGTESEGKRRTLFTLNMTLTLKQT